MASRQLDTVIEHIRRLASPPGYELSDRQLLDQFVRQRDEGAFSALVERHGPMVFGVCRRVLRHDQDAETGGAYRLIIRATIGAAKD